MGLETTHGCWHGSYSYFHYWREAVCKAAGLGELADYVGFGGDKAWPDPETDALVYLLSHSDCDGRIETRHCGKIADRLDGALPELTRACPSEGAWVVACARLWIDGLRLASDLGEDVEFH